MGESWASLLGRLRRAYTAAGLNCGDRLRPPAESDALDRFARLGVRVPPSLRALWRLHGGQRYITPCVTGLFGKHRLLAPSEAAGDYRTSRANNLDPDGAWPPAHGKVCYFHPRLLPFASWDANSLCLDTATGRVWEFSPNYGARGGTSRPSLRALVGELLALLAAGRPPEPDFIFRRPPDAARWRTGDVMAIARGIAADGAADGLPILADALEEAVCGDRRVLSACRRGAKYPDGWWVIDLLLGGA